jgi:hypothetical protein
MAWSNLDIQRRACQEYYLYVSSSFSINVANKFVVQLEDSCLLRGLKPCQALERCGRWKGGIFDRANVALGSLIAVRSLVC